MGGRHHGEAVVNGVYRQRALGFGATVRLVVLAVVVVIVSAPPALGAKPPDTTPPKVPSGLSAAAVSATQVDLVWQASRDTRGGSVAGYGVYRDSVLIATVTTTQLSDTAVSPSTTYSYTVDAVDTVGNRSAQSAPLVVTTPSTPDQTPPNAPDGLSAAAVSPTQVNLSWSAATDNVGVAGYGVYRDGVLIATVPTTAYSDTAASPSTTYSYTVDAFDAANNRSAPSAPAIVTTPSAPPADPVIAAAGDVACDPADGNFNGGLGTGDGCQMLATSNLLTPELAAVLVLGDIQYECGGYQAYLQSYDHSWGRVKPITYPTVGNHEFQTSGGTDCSTGAAGTKQYFLPLPNPVSGFPDQSYYSYNIGAWHIIALNSECAFVACAAGSPQETWLRQDLANNSKVCTVAYWHKPRWAGTRSWSGLQPLWNALAEFHADLNLVGHEHTYQRFSHLDTNGNPVPSGGIRQLIIGTGGKTLLGWVPAPGQELVDDSHFGVLKLTLHATSYSWAFVATDGTIIDSGTDTCVV
jgi:chitodextrinase